MAAVDLYPYASPQGTPIPLEIVKPIRMVGIDFGTSAAVDLTIPLGYDTCWIYATEDCVIQEADAGDADPYVSGDEYLNAMFVPASTPVSVFLSAANLRIVPLGTAGRIFVNKVQQWGGLVQNKQSSFG